MTLNISNKSNTMDILKKYGLTLKKSLGQNFIIEPKILDKIIKKAEIDKDTGVLEIGPGIGSLTQKLAEQAGKVVAIEIDKRLIPILEDTLSNTDNTKIIHGDVLKISLEEIIEKELNTFSTIKVVANLPYYVTSPIIIKLLEDKLPLDTITIMVQKEVAERISAKPGGKEYGSLTVFVEYFAEAKISFHVPSTVFIPKPNVDSAVLNLKIKQDYPIHTDDEQLLFKVIRTSFMHRRKTIFNNLKILFEKEQKEELLNILDTVKINPQRRAESISLKEYINLSQELKSLLTFNKIY